MRLSTYIVVGFSIAALAGCTSQPSAPVIDMRALQERATLAADSGDPMAAAALYRELANASRGEARAGYLIEGARLSIAAGDLSRAEPWLQEARTDATSEQNRTITILLARAEVALERPDSALAMLTGLQPPFTIEQSRDIAEVRALALFDLGRLAEAVRTLVDREIWFSTADEIRANQRLIWDGLSTADPSASPGRRTGDDVIDGWLALVPLTALTTDVTAFRSALIEWRREFVDHPATGGILMELLAEQRSAGGQPRRIALLLPLGSARRTQALAVRDGFIAAHLASPSHGDSTIAVYDTAPRGVADAYLAAQLDGSDFIVGPLLANEVGQVIEQAGFVPTLALNFAQLEGQFPPSFYQFALSPDDEARAIAERAIAAGQHTAIALFASNDRGYRLVASFREAFEALGGTVLSAAAYVPETQNFSQPITELLNISRSEQRHRRLQANLGRPVEFEPRRRQDVDMIFLQADDAGLGRLLTPELRFFDAGDVPTYATSDIYDTARQGSDSDLNGVMFPDLPLLLAPDGVATSLASELAAHWPQRSRQWIRLYAFGYDAYRLIGRLYSADPFAWPMPGVTGDLAVDGQGRIRRGLPFAQFRNGRPVAIPSLPAAPLPGPDTLEGIVGAR